MKRTSTEQAIIFFGLIALTVGLRLYFQYLPNFAPVAAVAMFAGYYFTSRRVAFLVPMLSMLITDAIIGSYQPLLMVTVYSLLLVPILMRSWLRSSFDLSSENTSAIQATTGLLGTALVASVLFFVGTNVATWWVTAWYPRTLEGLSACVTAGIPFFRYTLAGDVVFATLLFGGYAFAESRHRAGVVAAPEAQSL